MFLGFNEQNREVNVCVLNIHDQAGSLVRGLKEKEAISIKKKEKKENSDRFSVIV